MTNDEARSIIEARWGSVGLAKLGRLVELVTSENQRQNLIAPSTVETIWSRHILDSVQLVDFVEAGSGLWIDIGTGGGFPGLAIAVVRVGPMLLVEPRRLRAQFLTAAVAELQLEHVEVVAARIETIRRSAQTISARAVASIEKLLPAARACATKSTTWLLPRGQLVSGEFEIVKKASGMMFHVKHSLTDPASTIMIATGIPRK